MVDKENTIGLYFKQFIGVRGIKRKKVMQRLGFDYSDNSRMMCAFFKKADRNWKEWEVEKWCGVLGIDENTPVYAKLVSRCGEKKSDID